MIWKELKINDGCLKSFELIIEEKRKKIDTILDKKN